MKKAVSFKDLINSDTPVLVDFSAEWCGPCKAMVPVLQEVSSVVGKKASIVKIDVDKNRQLASSMKIKGVPTLILFKNGKAIWRESGVQSVHTLTNIIEANA